MSQNSTDSDDLEALFDRIVAENDLRNSPPAANKSPNLTNPPAGPPDEVLNRIGQLTRTLHESLRELGFDKELAKAASAIPDARERMAYVADMTEKAAHRALAASEAAKPLQERLGAEATALAGSWDRLFANQVSVEEFRDLAARTRAFLHAVPGQTNATQQHLFEIIMAQDFQDLTGQVIKRMTEMTHAVEKQLVELLVEHAPADRREALCASGLAGPVIGNGAGQGVVTSQQQVDELLESLGF
jgi:chemotaxis protein CheZ